MLFVFWVAPGRFSGSGAVASGPQHGGHGFLGSIRAIIGLRVCLFACLAMAMEWKDELIAAVKEDVAKAVLDMGYESKDLF